MVKTSLAHYSMRRASKWKAEGHEGTWKWFILLFLGNFDSTISPISFQCRKYCCISQGVNGFVHAGYQVQIQDWHFFELPVVEADVKTSSFFGTWRLSEHNPVGGINNVNDEHSIYFLPFKTSGLRPCAVWSRVYWSAIRLFKVDSVLQQLNQIKMSAPHALKLWEHITKFFSICSIFVV